MKKLLIILLLISSPLFSQGPWGPGGNPNGGGNGNGNNGQPCWPPPCVSIDTYIYLLALSGFLLIVYYSKDKKKHK